MVRNQDNDGIDVLIHFFKHHPPVLKDLCFGKFFLCCVDVLVFLIHVTESDEVRDACLFEILNDARSSISNSAPSNVDFFVGPQHVAYTERGRRLAAVPWLSPKQLGFSKVRRLDKFAISILPIPNWQSDSAVLLSSSAAGYVYSPSGNIVGEWEVDRSRVQCHVPCRNGYMALVAPKTFMNESEIHTMTEAIKTKNVQGRRDVHYESWEAMLGEAVALSEQDTRTLGNWSYPQILWHIASSLNTSIDGAGFSFPAPARWLMSLLMKRKFLTKSLPAGFKTSKHLIADESLSVDAALDSLRAAISRQSAESHRAIHPGFGKMTKEEHTAFHLRHAEMHMSFVVPADS